MSQPRVFQINLSNGSVPKLPVHAATVTPLGLEGDCQNDREHPGWARLYARVMSPGAIRTGDEVQVR